MAKVVTDSSSGETVVTQTGSNPSDRTSEISEPDNFLSERISENTAVTLPGRHRGDGTINWIGSSYSGADIKVVAHLYGDVGADEEVKSLNDQVAEAQAVTDALSAFLSLTNGLDQSALRVLRTLYSTGGSEAFLRAGNLTSSSIGASDFLAYYSPFISDPAGTVIAMRSQVEEFRAISDALREKIKTKEEFLGKSTSTAVLATLQTLSVQTHREKFPVRALGQSYVKGYTKGPRTIAGSMIFTVFNEHALAQLIRAMSGKGSIYGEDNELSTLIADQLPPIDLTIVFANEYGSLSQMGIYGVEFVNDGITMSIEDLLTEEVVNFVARDVDVMTAKGYIRLSRLQRGMHSSDTARDTTASDLLFSSRDSYNAYLDKLHVRRRLRNR